MCIYIQNIFKEKVAPTDTQLLNEVEGKEIVTLIMATWMPSRD